jgi:hypothetical protein
LRLGHGDCKHYSGFIAGVIDAVNRKTGAGIDWVYRFASYDIFDPTPVHVFIVVKDYGREIWIDPVLKKLNQRDPQPTYFIDKKISNSMPLIRIAGTPANIQPMSIGAADVINPYEAAAKQVSALDNVVTSQIPFYGLAKGLIESFFGKGGISDWLSPTGILNEIKFALTGRLYRGGQYWLGEKFKYYVMGLDIHTRDADVVGDPTVATAITVFSTGFGVPVEDYQDILNLDAGRDAYIARYVQLGVTKTDIYIPAVDRAVTLKRSYFPFNEVKTGVVPQKWDVNNFNRLPFVAPIPDFTKPYSEMWKFTYTGAIPGGTVKDGVVIAGSLAQASAPLTAAGKLSAGTWAIIGAGVIGAYLLLRKKR